VASDIKISSVTSKNTHFNPNKRKPHTLSRKYGIFVLIEDLPLSNPKVFYEHIKLRKTRQ